MQYSRLCTLDVSSIGLHVPLWQQWSRHSRAGISHNTLTQKHHRIGGRTLHCDQQAQETQPKDAHRNLPFGEPGPIGVDIASCWLSPVGAESGMLAFAAGWDCGTAAAVIAVSEPATLLSFGFLCEGWFLPVESATIAKID